MYKCHDEIETTRCCPRENSCLNLVLIILGGLFLFALGLLIGAIVSAVILANLAAIAVLVTVLFILTIVTLIYICCRRKRHCGC